MDLACQSQTCIINEIHSKILLWFSNWIYSIVGIHEIAFFFLLFLFGEMRVFKVFQAFNYSFLKVALRCYLEV